MLLERRTVPDGTALRGWVCQRKFRQRRGLLHFLLPPAGIAQPQAKHRLDIQIGDNEVFLELPPAGNHFAGLIQDETVAVKDKFVLATDKIVVCHDDRVIDRTRLQHPLAPLPLSKVVG